MYLLSLLLICMTACVSASNVAMPRSDTLAADTALFATALRSMDRHPSERWLVDPRPLIAEFDPEEMAGPGDLAPVEPHVLRAREATAKRLGTDITDAFQADECFMTGGLGPAPPPPGASAEWVRSYEKVMAKRERCKEMGDYVRVIMGIPRSSRQTSDRVIVRVQTTSSAGYVVTDVELAPASSGFGWVVTEKRIVGGVVS